MEALGCLFINFQPEEVRMHDHLFSAMKVRGISLRNRLTMAPLYLGYAGEGGTISNVLLEHYRLMGQSGVALVVVENATVDHPQGSGSNRTIRADTDDNLPGLKQLSQTIKQGGAMACLQINHAGRFAGATREPVAPSAVETFGRVPAALSTSDIDRIIEKFARAAQRAKAAGFDMVELHGGTGYLLSEFVSPRTNRRMDEYGGPLRQRQRFPLQVLAEVRRAVGDFPVGYRFLADEWLPDGLQLSESTLFAETLEEAGIDYISVMGGTYESFSLSAVREKSAQQGYMLDLAAVVKARVKVPVVAAGRFSTGDFAERAVAEGKTDLIGLARVLWADPEWPEKVRRNREQDIIHCGPECGDACNQMVMKGRPALCVKWPAEKMKAWKAKFE
jgi:NADPH2 dehydrogenase